jgi:hypothetical protein
LKLTIDNHDGLGAVDYSPCVLAGRPFRIVRRLNEPVVCEVTLLPAQGRSAPARNGRITVADDDGNLLFTGYIATEPAPELAGRGTTGAVYRTVVSAISDDILLSRQSIPPAAASYGLTAGQALQTLLARVEVGGIAAQISQATQSVSQYEAMSGRSWAENTGALANSTRNAWRLMNGTLTMLPVGAVTHNLSEADGTLSLSSLELSMVKALANDVTVCGEEEPCAYVTEFFEGNGMTLQFNLTREPYIPPDSRRRPVTELFDGPTINPQLWALDDPGAALSLTSAGLTCCGGSGRYGGTMLSSVSDLELGGSLVLELGGVQFGAQTTGIMNGCYNGGGFAPANCLFGFQVTQPSGATTISPLINGVVAGSSFTPVSGHLYTLRARFSSPEVERILQAYYAAGTDNAVQLFGSRYIDAGCTLVLEVQETSNGVAGAPVVLYSGSLSMVPPTSPFVPLNSSCLQCSIGCITVEQQGPLWITSTIPGGTPVARRLGTPAQGADCTIDRAGRLLFYPVATPQTGEVLAVSYRTRRRSVARLANSASVASESAGGALPGTACWMGTVTSPAPRSSADCENAAQAILCVSTSRAAAWSGRYTACNPELQGDIWPGDVLAIAATSAGVTASLIVRSVQIDLACTAPSLAKYTLIFANDWADELAVRTTAAIPSDVWLPQQPQTTTPLASLKSLCVTAVTGSEIQIAAGVTAPAGGGFEVRRRDWAFTAGQGPDLVLRSPVPNFTLPRQAAMERYYIRMYDGSNPPNYSRFSSAVFVNLPLAT